MAEFIGDDEPLSLRGVTTFDSVLSTAATIAKTDPSQGLTSFVHAGMSTRPLFGDAGTIYNSALAQQNALSAYSSLSAVSGFSDTLRSHASTAVDVGGLTVARGYVGTLNSISALSTVSAGVLTSLAAPSFISSNEVSAPTVSKQSPLSALIASKENEWSAFTASTQNWGTSPLFTSADVSAFTASTNRWAGSSLMTGSLIEGLTSPRPESVALNIGIADGLSLGRAITTPYLASTAAVFDFESRLAKSTVFADAATLTFAHKAASTVLYEGLATLSGALVDTWNAAKHGPVLTSAPADFLRWPAIEVYIAAKAANVLSFPIEVERDTATDVEVEDILADATDSIEARLAGLDQGLIQLYRGATEAITRGGTDWQRHAMTSFRELCTHVLHKLAPDALILPLLTDDDLHQGRPTRRARLRYIFAPVTGSAVADFFEADLRAAIQLFDVLNEQTHKLVSSATPAQAFYLRGRVIGLIASMLEAQGY